MDFDGEDDEDDLFEDAEAEQQSQPDDSLKNDQDNEILDADGDQEQEQEQDQEVEDDQDQEDDIDDEPSQGIKSPNARVGTPNGSGSDHKSPSSRPTSPSDVVHLSFKESHPIAPSRDIFECSSFDILPTVAMLHSCPIYSMAFSWGMKWMFTGGHDGFIRKYNFVESVNGKVPLTVAQRHPFVDSVTKAGVLAGYWENEQPFLESDPKRPKRGSDGMYEPVLSPVYSLAVQAEALWLLSGLESGGITLQTVRHEEGSIQAYLNKHTSSVSCLSLDADEQSVLSGSWDKSLLMWDLNTGQYSREFHGCTGQISSIEWQPEGGIVVDASMANLAPPPTEDAKNDKPDEDQEEDMDSLFGSDEEDDEHKNKDKGEDVKDEAMDVDENENSDNKDANDDEPSEQAPPKQTLSHTTFLSSCIDGSIDIWDKRQENKISRVTVASGTPPWAMSACWSTDGNNIYVGRRNATLDEYDLRSSLSSPARTFKFPSVSGPVSALRTLPDGRHLLCASNDNIRLYDLKTSAKVPFFIIPGHHGACISSLYVDPACKYMVSSSGNRGWQGTSTDVALVYEIHPNK